MKLLNKKIGVFLFSTLFIIGFFALSSFVQAQGLDTGLEPIEATGLGQLDIREIIANIIKVALGLLGIAALVLILYGGYKWMTAAGNEDQISEAKKILTNATIGLVIILSAYSIVNFVLTNLLKATGANVTDLCVEQQAKGQMCDGYCAPCQNCTTGNCEENIFRISTMPAGGNMCVRNVYPAIVFNKEVDVDSLEGKIVVQKASVTTDVPGNWQWSQDNHKIAFFVPEGNCPSLDNGKDCLDANTNYVLKIKDKTNPGVSSVDGKQLQCGLGSKCDDVVFTTGANVDRTPPTVTILPPDVRSWDDQSQGENIPVRISFADDNGLQNLTLTADNYSVNSINFSGCQKSGTATIVWATNNFTVGSHTLKALGLDFTAHSGQFSQVVKLKPSHCANKIKDSDEVKTDCGGTCGACEGDKCIVDADCASGYCEKNGGTEGICINKMYITGFSPAEAAKGDYVSILGRYFGKIPGKVYFTNELGGYSEAPVVNCGSSYKNWTDNQIIVSVPSEAVSGTIKVETASTTGADGFVRKFTDFTGSKGWKKDVPVADFVLSQIPHPSICLLSPNKNGVGADVDIAGKNFGTYDPSKSYVKFASANAQIKNWPDMPITKICANGKGACTKDGDCDVEVTSYVDVTSSVQVGSCAKDSAKKCDLNSDCSTFTLLGKTFYIQKGAKGMCHMSPQGNYYVGDGSFQCVTNSDCVTAKNNDPVIKAWYASKASGSSTFNCMPLFTFANPNITTSTCNFQTKIITTSVPTTTIQKSSCTLSGTATTTIASLVPVSLGNGNYGVKVENNNLQSNTLIFNVFGSDPNGPFIESVSASSGVFGDYLTINGKNFGDTPNYSDGILFTQMDSAGDEVSDSTVAGNNNFPETCKGKTWSDTQIIIKIPNLSGVNSKYFVRVKRSDAVLSPLDKAQSVKFLTGDAKPGICNISPDNGPVPFMEGKSLTVSGEHFGSAPSIYFWQLSASSTSITGRLVTDQIISSDDNTITLRPPTSTVSGPVVVYRNADSKMSNSVAFNVFDCIKNNNTCSDSQNYKCCASGLDSGSCVLKADNCSQNIRSSGYVWLFSTSKIQTKPQVLEQCSLESEGSASPSPSTMWNVNGRTDASNVCLNSVAQVIFNVDNIDASTVNSSNVQVRKCPNYGNGQCGTDPVSETVSINFKNGKNLEIAPNKSNDRWDPETWYQVVLSKNIKTGEGLELLSTRSCGGDSAYCYFFRSGLDDCKLRKVIVIPLNYWTKVLEAPIQHRSLGSDPYDLIYQANGLSNQYCIMMNVSGLAWSWGSSSTTLASTNTSASASLLPREAKFDAKGNTVGVGILGDAVKITAKVDYSATSGSCENDGSACVSDNNCSEYIFKQWGYNLKTKASGVCATYRTKDRIANQNFAGFNTIYTIPESAPSDIVADVLNCTQDSDCNDPSFIEFVKKYSVEGNLKEPGCLNLSDFLSVATTYKCIKENTQKTGTSSLVIDLANPDVVDYGPKCLEACTNAEVWAKFNTSMSDHNVGSGIGSVKLQKCNDENCNDLEDSIVTTSVHFATDRQTLKIYNIGAGEALEKNALYQATLSATSTPGTDNGNQLWTMKNASSSSFAKPYNKVFTWRFRTKSSACAVSRVDVLPEVFNVQKLFDKAIFEAEAYGSPDTCSKTGQKLNAWEKSWTWTSSDTAVADVKTFISKGRNQYCTSKCTLRGSAVPAAEGIVMHPLCGNGKLEAGEDCDSPSVSGNCGLNCLYVNKTNKGSQAVPNSSDPNASICGNGSIGIGEDCDLGVSPSTTVTTSSLLCSQNCLHQGTKLSAAWCASSATTTSGFQDSEIKKYCSFSYSQCGDGVPGPDEDAGCDIGEGKFAPWCNSSCLVEIRTSTYSSYRKCNIGSEGCTEFGNYAGSSLLYSTSTVCGDKIPGTGEAPVCEEFNAPNRTINDPWVLAIGKGGGIATGTPAVKKTNITAETVDNGIPSQGSGVYQLQCGYSSDEECQKDQPGSGVGSDSCCYNHPKVTYVYPGSTSTPESNKCINTAIDVKFDSSIEEKSIQGNFIIARGIVTGDCPTGTVQIDGLRNTGVTWYGKIWNKIVVFVKNIFGNEASAGDVKKWCAESNLGNINVVNESGASTISLKLKKALEKNTDYVVILKNGITNTRGVSIEKLIDGKPFSWRFITGSNLCQIDKVEVEPDQFYFSKPNLSAFFTASVKTQNGQSIQAIPGVYNWHYVWGPKQNSYVEISTNTEFGYTDGTIAQITSLNRNGELDIHASANVTEFADKPKNIGIAATGKSHVIVFLCENPWPPKEPVTIFPYEDKHGNNDNFDLDNSIFDGGQMTASNVVSNGYFNFSTYYCADNGGVGTLDDLPYLEPVVNSSLEILANGEKIATEKITTSTVTESVEGQCKYNQNEKCFADGDCESFVVDGKGEIVSSAKRGLCGVEYTDSHGNKQISYFTDPSPLECSDFGQVDQCTDDSDFNNFVEELGKNESLKNQSALCLESTCQNNTKETIKQNKELIYSLAPTPLNALKRFIFTNTKNNDAIGIQVFPNPKHLSPKDWFGLPESQGGQDFKGNIQTFAIDCGGDCEKNGYEAATDGNNIYVNALNFSTNSTTPQTGDLYTNIYLFSINSDSTQETRKVFEEMMKNLKFNINLSNYGYCGASLENPGDITPCQTDFDCVAGEVCSVQKDKLRRNYKRLQDISEIEKKLNTYKIENGSYPTLNAGTYLTGQTLSTWDSSWTSLGNALKFIMPVDPINKLGIAGTCSATTGKFCTKDTDCVIAGKCSSTVTKDCYSNADCDFTNDKRGNCSLKNNKCAVNNDCQKYCSNDQNNDCDNNSDCNEVIKICGAKFDNEEYIYSDQGLQVSCDHSDDCSGVSYQKWLDELSAQDIFLAPAVPLCIDMSKPEGTCEVQTCKLPASSPNIEFCNFTAPQETCILHDPTTGWSTKDNRFSFACTTNSLAYRYISTSTSATTTDYNFKFRWENPGIQINNSNGLFNDFIVTSSHFSLMNFNAQNNYGICNSGQEISTINQGTCGDKQLNVNKGEQCDPPGTIEWFTSQCTNAAGTMQGKKCLDNCQWGGSATYVTTTCSVLSKCGNYKVEPGEVCDDGAENGKYNHCSKQCDGLTANGWCGDGLVTSTYEVCDVAQNFYQSAPSPFSTNASSTGWCFGGIRNNVNCELDSDCNSLNSDTSSKGICVTLVKNKNRYGLTKEKSCNFDCQKTGPYCGDGNVDYAFGEECDIAKITTCSIDGQPGERKCEQCRWKNKSAIAYYKFDDVYLFGGKSNLLNSAFTANIKEFQAYCAGLTCPAISSDAVSKQSQSFNSNDSEYLEIGSDNRFNVNELTIATWLKVRFATVSSTVAPIISKMSANNIDYTLLLNEKDGKVVNLKFDSFFNGQSILGSAYAVSSTNSSSILSTSTWHFVAVTIDANRLGKFYIDGKPFGNTFNNGNKNTSAIGTYPIWISKYTSPSTGSTTYFNGQLDELQMYNRALSSEEISDLHSNTHKFCELNEIVPVAQAEEEQFCGNGKIDKGEDCDTGSTKLNIACTPAYGKSCQYCTDKCLVVDVKSNEFCGDGVISNTEVCDTDVQGIVYNITTTTGSFWISGLGLGSLTTVSTTHNGYQLRKCAEEPNNKLNLGTVSKKDNSKLFTYKKGDKTCSSDCSTLTNNCVECGSASTGGVKITGGIINVLDPDNNAPLSMMGGVGNNSLELFFVTSSQITSTFSSQKINYGVAASSLLKDQMYTLMDYTSTTLVASIESNPVCSMKNNNDGSEQPHYIMTINSSTVISQAFDFPIYSNPTPQQYNLILSPAIHFTPDYNSHMRIVVSWIGSKVDFASGFLIPPAPGTTQSIFDGLSGMATGTSNYKNVPTISPMNGMWYHKSGEVNGTGEESFTVNVNNLSTSTVGFYVKKIDPIWQSRKLSKLKVELYFTENTNNFAHFGRPVKVYYIDNALASQNTEAKYWHVFNIKKRSSGAASFGDVVEVNRIVTDSESLQLQYLN